MWTARSGWHPRLFQFIERSKGLDGGNPDTTACVNTGLNSIFCAGDIGTYDTIGTPGTYTPGGLIAIFDGMPTSTIHYTLDGSIPTITSPVYTDLISLTSTGTINAIAMAPG